jgi:hypothetical protein
MHFLLNSFKIKLYVLLVYEWPEESQNKRSKPVTELCSTKNNRVTFTVTDTAISAYSAAGTMSSETVAVTYETTRYHMAEEHSLKFHHCTALNPI